MRALNIALLIRGELRLHHWHYWLVLILIEQLQLLIQLLNRHRRVLLPRVKVLLLWLLASRVDFIQVEPALELSGALSEAKVAGNLWYDRFDLVI